MTTPLGETDRLKTASYGTERERMREREKEREGVRERKSERERERKRECCNADNSIYFLRTDLHVAPG